MIRFVKTNTNNKILSQLILDNCLSFGRSPKLNNKKINHYIFGTRQKINIFKLYEIRYLLLKIYPLIHNLFLQARLNKTKKKKWFFYKNFDFETQNLPQEFKKKKNFYSLKDKFNKTLREEIARSLPPKILFATTTPIYSEIVSSAAKKCRMPFHVNRWLSGAVTAASSYLIDEEKWSVFLNDFTQNDINSCIQNQFFKHKKNLKQQKNKVNKYQFGRKPTLIIIPDISNNEMILKETSSVGIPALGLVNSHCDIEIEYPIFANDLSLYSIHFFCHFVSSLILKEFNKFNFKIYTRKKKIRIHQFVQANKDIIRFTNRILKIKAHQNDYQTNGGDIKKYSFKGKFFINHYTKPRKNIRRHLKKKNKKHQPYFSKKKTKPKIKMVSPKKLISVENRKRLTKKRINFYWKKRILSKMKLIKNLQNYNFSKILREIRLRRNKPLFRYWNKRTFWFSNRMKFATNTFLGYTFRRIKLKRLLRNALWKIRQKIKREKYEERQKKRKYYRRKWFLKKKLYQLWFPKKKIKNYRKQHRKQYKK